MKKGAHVQGNFPQKNQEDWKNLNQHTGNQIMLFNKLYIIFAF